MVQAIFPPMDMGYVREITPAGRVRLRADGCTFVVERLRRDIVLATCVGHDRGQFGDAVLAELAKQATAHSPLELFVDARRVFNATVGVSERWAQWFQANRATLESVHVLVASKYVHMTMEVAKLFSRTGELMRIYTELRPFEETVARRLGLSFMLDDAARCREL
jgi:hypothetical protein